MIISFFGAKIIIFIENTKKYLEIRISLQGIFCFQENDVYYDPIYCPMKKMAPVDHSLMK